MESTHNQKLLALISGAITVLLLLIVGFFVTESAKAKANKNTQQNTTIKRIEVQDVTEKIKPHHILPPDKFKNLDLVAKAVYVFKPETHQLLYAKHAHTQLPLASIAKVMNAIVVAEYMHPDNIVTVPKRSLAKYGASTLKPNEKWRVGDLLNFTMMVSSNDGANALAAATAGFMKGTKNNTAKDFNANIKDFKRVMNQKAKSLGLTQTYFLDETGLDLDGDVSGAYGSARDVAYMFDYALRHAGGALAYTDTKDAWFTSKDDILHPAINTDTALGDIPGFIAGKTGYTPLAGGNLVVAFDAGMSDPVIAVVLGSTKQGRFEDMKKIVHAVLATPHI